MLPVNFRTIALRPLILAVMPFIAWILLPSCAKEEGPGGTGSISGTITEYYYNHNYSRLIYQKPAIDQEVFILYGENDVVGDRTFTGPTGEFRFNFLYPGEYYIYFLSRDSTMLLDENREKMFLVFLERGQDLDLGNLEKLSTLDFDEGAAVIKGVVKVIDYVNESRWPNLVIREIAFAQEQEIYLAYDHEDFYRDRIRTKYNGYFEFDHLIPGDYVVFLYSEDVTGETDRVVVKFEVTITELDQVVDLGEIIIEKL